MSGSILIPFMVVVTVRIQISTSCPEGSPCCERLSQHQCGAATYLSTSRTGNGRQHWICAPGVTSDATACSLSKENRYTIQLEPIQSGWQVTCRSQNWSGRKCLKTGNGFKVTITCPTDDNNVVQWNIKLYKNIAGDPSGCETDTAEVSNVLPFEPVYYPVEVCNLDEETVHLTVKEFYFKLQNEKADLPDDQINMKSIFHKPVKECYCYGICTSRNIEDRVEDLKFIGYSEVTFVNSPDSVLRNAARRALNIL